MATVIVCFPSSACVYIQGGEATSGLTTQYTRTNMYKHSQTRVHTAHPCPTFCEHRECGRASLRNHHPQSDTCTGVQTIRFLGSVLATARFICSISIDQLPRRRRCSRDCTAYICLRRLRTTTLNIHTRCLV
jgi:hypothetical protein